MLIMDFSGTGKCYRLSHTRCDKNLPEADHFYGAPQGTRDTCTEEKDQDTESESEPAEFLPAVNMNSENTDLDVIVNGTFNQF